MDLGNAIFFWILSGVVLLVLNFILFRFGFVRKLITLASSIGLIIIGFDVSKRLKENAIYINGGVSWDDEVTVTLVTLCVVMVGIVLLMSFDDTLMDFEDGLQYDVEGFAFLGTYYITGVTVEHVEFPSFLTCYGIATAIAIVVYFVGIKLLKWFWMFGVFGIIALAWLVVIKPILLKVNNSY